MQEIQEDIKKGVIMNYVFQVGKSFGNIEFTDTEEIVISKLGTPSSVLEEEFDNTKVVMKSIEYEYADLEISIDFRYWDNEYGSCTIFSEKIILENQNLYDLKKKEIFKIINKYSKISYKDAFKQDLEMKKNLGKYYDDEYIFEDIGITLWFHKNKLNDACVYLPSED